MKTASLILILSVLAAFAQESSPPSSSRPGRLIAPPPGMIQPISARPPGMSTPVQAEPQTNYQLTVLFKEGKESVRQLKVATTTGRFTLNGAAPEKVQIDDRLIPTTITLEGTLEVLADGRCRLNLMLGRTRPYITGTMNTPAGKTSQYQQMQEGLTTTVLLTPDKPLVVQADDTQEISVIIRPMPD